MFIPLYQNNENGLLFLHASMLEEKIFPIFIFSRAKECRKTTLCIMKVMPQWS
jgi:hypothetical protein